MMVSEIRNRAEAIFKKKTIALREGERAMEDYKADQRAKQEKTARLRALRLARDQADKKTDGAEPARPDCSGLADALPREQSNEGSGYED